VEKQTKLGATREEGKILGVAMTSFVSSPIFGAVALVKVTGGYPPLCLD
jgi:hypothetical protein